MFQAVEIEDRQGAGPFRRVALAAAVVVALLLSAAGTLGLGGAALAQDAPATQADGEELSVADVAELANPAVVTITSLGEGFRGSGEALPVGTGSGFIIDADGHVVTNNHVVEGADELSVQFFDGDTVSATVVGRDPVQDIAVLQLDLDEGQAVPAVLAFGETEDVRAGDEIVSIGSALGEFTNTVTDGIVSAVDRSLGEIPNLLQHDAPIWPGNSGGPILNLEGEVIGVNVAGVGGARGVDSTPAQIAFAIEIDIVEQLVDEILATGEAVWPYLGIFGGAVNDGHQVAEVVEGGPAEDAGIEADDVIIAIDDQPIDGPNGLIDALAQHDPGDTVSVAVDRAGETETVEVTLGERPAADA